MQEMKEKELRYLGNGDANSHVCKICFESTTAAMLLPCRHFCCKYMFHTKHFVSGLYIFTDLWHHIMQCVSLVLSPVLNAQFAAQRLPTEFLHLPDIAFLMMVS